MTDLIGQSWTINDRLNIYEEREQKIVKNYYFRPVILCEAPRPSNISIT